MLADLDELVLRCRDERAKAYIGEAVACYRAGAYRASIISTWIAVAFDIIDKVRELSFAGDRAAEEFTERFDAITRDNDLTRALQFERDLLVNARDRFELISAQEFLDLERLQQDRHRCAHPSRTAAMEVFAPPAELARAHIRTAVDHLLQHEPAQGKAAFDSVIKIIESDYFPTKRDLAQTVLAKTALRRARPSLVRNLVIVLIKGILHRRPGDVRLWQRRTEALMCVRAMYPALWQATVAENLSRIVRALDTVDQLCEVVEFLDLDPAFDAALEEDQFVRLGEFLRRLPRDKVYLFGTTNVLSQGRLREAALERVHRVTTDEVSDIEFFGSPPPVWDAVVERYRQSQDFDTANAWGKVIVENAHSFSLAQVRVILRAAIDNDQVRGAFSLKRVLHALERRDKLTAELQPLVDQVNALL